MNNKLQCIEFFNTLEPTKPLYLNGTQSILDFTFTKDRKQKDYIRLGMPKYVKINEIEELGPGAFEHWIELFGVKFTLDKTPQDVLTFLNSL